MMESLMSSDNWMLWGLMSVGLLVIAVLLLTGGALIKIMFFEDRGGPDDD